MFDLQRVVLVTATLLAATVHASVGLGRDDLGVFICEPRLTYGIGRNDPRLEKTGWIVRTFNNGGCSNSYGIFKELVPERTDPEIHIIDFSCRDDEIGRKLLLFGWHRFPSGSRVKVTFRISGSELMVEGDAQGTVTIQVPLDPSELATLTDSASEFPELQIELAQGLDIVRGVVRLNHLSAALKVLQEICPLEPVLPSTRPATRARRLGAIDHTTKASIPLMDEWAPSALKREPPPRVECRIAPTWSHAYRSGQGTPEVHP